ncbi:MAG: DUF2207 domain-containing protein [Candidatus Obscuribacterales bacterium]|nr:DUF2207 domain-containing protein [Candidatus Obscuribacterales bacterium]
MLKEIESIAVRSALLSLLFIFLSLFAAESAQAQVIREFKSNVTVSRSGDVDVCEDYDISFPAKGRRTKFYRILPVWYETPKGRHAVDIRMKNVVLDEKQDVPFHSWISNRYFYLRIGDQGSVPFTNSHHIKIEYQVNNAVNFVNGRPQLLINVTGEQTPFPISKSTVVINVPDGTAMTAVKASGSVGNGKKRRPVTVTAGGAAITFKATNLKPAQSMTLDVDLPVNSVVPHSVLYNIVWLLQCYYQVFVLPVGTAIALFAWWWLFGRDPGAVKGEEATSWYPPEYLSAAEAGTLIDESCDLQDIVSTVIDLAARGYLSIRVLPYNGFLYLSNRDYEFTLLKSSGDPQLRPHEQLFLVALFGMSQTTYLSALKGGFVEYIPSIKRKVYNALINEKLFARDPEIDRKNFVSVGAVVLTAGLGLMLASAAHVTGQSAALGTAISGIILLLSARAMPQRTPKGVTSLIQLRRFQHMLQFGNRKELEKLAADDPGMFYRFLPYAVVLGLDEFWAVPFIKTVKDYPDWYKVDPRLLPPAFESVDFVNQLRASFSVINRALTDNPTPATTTNMDKLRAYKSHNDWS